MQGFSTRGRGLSLDPVQGSGSGNPLFANGCLLFLGPWGPRLDMVGVVFKAQSLGFSAQGSGFKVEGSKFRAVLQHTSTRGLLAKSTAKAVPTNKSPKCRMSGSGALLCQFQPS